MLKETENPFGADEGDETQSASADSSRSPSSVVPERGGHGASSSLGGSKPAGSAQSFLSTSKDSKKKKDKNTKKKHKSFNLEAEKEQMKSKIAEASIAATNLMNTLQSINREQERISNNQAAVQRFEACKQLRRQILRYVRLGPANQPRPMLTIIPDPSHRIRAMARKPPPRQRRAGDRAYDVRATGPLN